VSGEVSYYNALKEYLVEQLDSNFKSLGKRYQVYGRIGELKNGLHTLIQEENLFDTRLQRYCDSVLPLNLDIFLVVTDNSNDFRIIICEVKKRPALGLMELSQLIGYCIIANCEYGLLVNVDNSCSTRFMDILHHEQGITHIYRTSGKGSASPLLKHHLGVMMWNSVTRRMTYTQTGAILTIPHLCDQIADSLG